MLRNDRRRRRSACGGMEILLLTSLVTLSAGGLFRLFSVEDASPDGTGVVGSRYARIQPGMTEEEVEAILGCPSGIHDHGFHGSEPVIGLYWPDGRHRSTWYFDEGMVYVYFDSKGQVSDKSFYRDGQKFDPSPTLAGKFRGIWRRVSGLLP